MKAVFINAKEKKVELVTLSKHDGLRDLQTRVEGYIEPAGKTVNGDTLLVNEEGLLRKFKYGFAIALVSSSGPRFVGNGVLTRYDGEGETISCKSKAEAVAKEIQWLAL